MGRITFTVNGVSYSVGSEVPSDLTLVDYLRNSLNLHGTKYMCREGGCGACSVVVQISPTQIFAINSCLVLLPSCHGWEITTIEGLGNIGKGYHPLQKALADKGGTQCGHCSPGFVMSMFGLLKSNPKITSLEVERSLGSNICRCTGYRPILDAFKSFASDAPKCNIENPLTDIEDIKICDKTKKKCDGVSNEDDWCFVEKDMVEVIELKLKDDNYWYKVHDIKEILNILQQHGDDSYMLVSGNTAKGVYPIDKYPRILIDISSVNDLKGCSIDQNLIVGVNTTITEFMKILHNVADKDGFNYLKQIHKHLQKVAHPLVRNLGTIAGNLMIKHGHPWFTSDIFLLLKAIDAQLTIVAYHMKKQTVTMDQFLRMDMRGRIILNILLPPQSDNIQMISYKIMHRSKNSHSIVSAAFLYELMDCGLVKKIRIVYTGLSHSTSRAYNTENYLLGKKLFSNTNLQIALKLLKSELIVNENPPEASVEYRKELALRLFYKSLLKLCPDSILDPRKKSGAIVLSELRPVSQAKQKYETDETLYPLNQPIPKLEGLIQCAGEAQYTDDLPPLPHQVYAAFVVSTVCVGTIVSFNTENALKLPGVIAFYTAKDIPGLNSFMPADDTINRKDEEVLCSGKVQFFNQPVGIIVAETAQLAERAAKLVVITYKDIKKPIVDINEAIKHKEKYEMFIFNEATDKGTEVTKVIKGGNTIYSQIHFTLENVVSIAHPTEDGLKMYVSSQWMDGVQLMLSRALNIPQHRIDVSTRRLGGGYGLKVSRHIQSAVSCGLVVQKLRRPCRFIQSFPSITRSLGKRLPCATSFEVGVNKTGVIQYMNYELYQDNGFDLNERFSVVVMHAYCSCYDKSRWNFKGFDAVTDTAKNTFCRAPGSLECVAMAELMMEQITYELQLVPIEVRLANLDKKHYKPIKTMIDDLKIEADYDKRRSAMKQFHIENRWKKRGLRFSTSLWTPDALGMYDVNLSVYHGDGTVSITHAGAEMGQGIDTKAIQICAYYLKIPINKILIKTNDTMIAPNSYQSGGSVTTQGMSIGVIECCLNLLKRLEPIMARMDNPSWEELITEAYKSNVDLQTHGFATSKDVDDNPYSVYGVALAEVEIDVLTGEFQILRVDIMEDVGRSVNPAIDIGQIEGAFTMGIGYWTTEKLVYDPLSGELLTNRTWNYKVPLCEDIPQDFRIYLRKHSYSTDAILGSKAVGEPPICLSVVVALALREAISAARLESGIPDNEWFRIDGPTTVEVVGLMSAVKLEDLTFS